ncbi:MAG: pyrroline-5-carboxylate reductase, partial [Alphaproteobacteria bacterium]
MVENLLLVGCGKMGSAMLTRWLQSDRFKQTHFTVIDPSFEHQTASLTIHRSTDELAANYKPDIILFAIKPQKMQRAVPIYADRFGKHPIYISIAAGTTLGALSMLLCEGAQVIRAMPNTPALVGAGITVMCPCPRISPETEDKVTILMEAIGSVAWIHDESLMDAVTALSGSGPAYVFLFLESLAEAGVQAGLPVNMARRLALQTILGSGILAERTREDFSILRENVTSPGGTTEAAMSVLMHKNAFKELLMEAFRKAAARS